MNRNHARQALNGKIYVVFFAALTILVFVLIQIFIADVYLHYALRFFMVYFVYWQCFLCLAFFLESLPLFFLILPQLISNLQLLLEGFSSNLRVIIIDQISQPHFSQFDNLYLHLSERAKCLDNVNVFDKVLNFFLFVLLFLTCFFNLQLYHVKYARNCVRRTSSQIINFNAERREKMGNEES